jgi:hypothetical protein
MKVLEIQVYSQISLTFRFTLSNLRSTDRGTGTFQNVPTDRISNELGRIMSMSRFLAISLESSRLTRDLGEQNRESMRKKRNSTIHL